MEEYVLNETYENPNENEMYGYKIGDKVIIKKIISQKKYGEMVTISFDDSQYIDSIGTVIGFSKECFFDVSGFNPILHTIKVRIDDKKCLDLLACDIEYIQKTEETRILECPMPKVIDKFDVIVDNFSLGDLKEKYKLSDKSMCFYRPLGKCFPVVEIRGGHCFNGCIEISILDNDTIYVKQK